MALNDSMLFSGQNAQHVAETIVHFLRELPDDYLALEIVSYGNGKEILHPNLNIRADRTGSKTTLADGSEIVHCLEPDGSRVDIFLGKPAERQFQPAQILLASSI